MNVSAVVVTRGDVPLDQILYTFTNVPEIDEVVVWDNSQQPEDAKTWGRHLALARCKNRVIYSQDDDLVHEPDTIQAILAAYEPGVISGCMWNQWSDGAARQGIAGGYTDIAFTGAGSVYDRETTLTAAARYLEHYPQDDFFRVWCDAIIGVIAPSKWIDERFMVLSYASNANRICNMENAASLKREAIRRARSVRDGTQIPDRPKEDGHTLYMAELNARLQRSAA